MKTKSLMTQYAEGSLISRDLHQMMHDYAAEVRFEREMTDDFDGFAGRGQWGAYVAKEQTDD